MGERRSDTRARIQSVALELFAEHGYDKTSLREIAERLEVTKAALYYHFNTKEDIVVSLFEDFVTGIDNLIEWATGQPRTLETRQEILRRYGALARERPKGMMKFIQDNKTAIKDLAPGEELESRVLRLAALLNTDASLTGRLRSTLALVATGAAVFMLKDTGASEDERYAAGLDLALELISGPPGTEQERVPQSTAR